MKYLFYMLVWGNFTFLFRDNLSTLTFCYTSLLEEEFANPWTRRKAQFPHTIKKLKLVILSGYIYL